MKELKNVGFYYRLFYRFRPYEGIIRKKKNLIVHPQLAFYISVNHTYVQICMCTPEHVSGAARENFRSPLTFVFAPSLHRSKSYQTAPLKDRSPLT